MNRRYIIQLAIAVGCSQVGLWATKPTSKVDIQQGMHFIQKNWPQANVYLINSETNHNHVFLTCDVVYSRNPGTEVISRRQYRFKKQEGAPLAYEGEAILEPEKRVLVD